jgi:hypothetical protein
MSQDSDAGRRDSAVGNSFQHLRRTPRFKAFEDRQMAVVVERAVGFEPREMRGRILDLSAGGAKMAVPFEIALQETIEVRFDLPEVTTELAVSATVCWARTAGGNSWRLGCSFAEELPESLLTELAVHGYIDRREDNRHTTGIAAAVQWDTTRETAAVHLHDVSVGGFSIVCGQTAAPGTRLRLLVSAADGEPVVVPAVVRWQRNTSDAFILGCAYIEEGAFRRLEPTLSASGNPPAPDCDTAERLAAAPTAAAAAIENVCGGPVVPMNVESASRSARRQLAAAAGAIGSSFVFLQFSSELGPLGWATTSASMLVAAWATASYHRLTQRVLAEAAEAARKGKLC